jgi:hypothetical protein
MSNPDEIRAQIEQTRRGLSDDVDALSDKVSPSAIAQRKVDRAKGAVGGIRDKVMGAAPSAGDLKGKAQGLLPSGSGQGTTSPGEVASGAQDKILGSTQGNPLAAGLIAFGAGWLISSLLPASGVEKKAVSQAKDKVAASPLKDQLTSAAQEVKGNLAGPAQQALESVKSTAQDSVATVKDTAASAGADVKDTAKAAAPTSS